MSVAKIATYHAFLMLYCLATFTDSLTNMFSSTRLWSNVDFIVFFVFWLTIVYLENLKLTKFDAIQMQIDLYKKDANESWKSIIRK